MQNGKRVLRLIKIPQAQCTMKAAEVFSVRGEHFPCIALALPSTLSPGPKSARRNANTPSSRVYSLTPLLMAKYPTKPEPLLVLLNPSIWRFPPLEMVENNF